MIASTNIALSLRATKRARTSALVGMSGLVYFAVAIIALHLLRPEHNPIIQPTSEYAVGTYGFVMTTAFFSMSLASFALVVGLSQALPPPARSRAGLVLLGFWAVGVLIAMIFPIDLNGAPQTLSGTIHQKNGTIAFLCATVGTLLISSRLKNDEKWRALHRPGMRLSLVMLAAFIGTGLSFATESGFGGLAQRIDLIALVTWMLLTAVHLR